MSSQETPGGEQLPLVPTEKRCTGCGEVKPLAAFSRHKKGKDGLNWWCRACNAAYCRAHHQEHKDTINAARREQAAKERQTRPETRAERDQSLLAQGPRHCGLCDQVKPLVEFGRLRRRPHGLMTQCRSCRNARAHGYRAANPDHARAWQRAWCRANPDRVRDHWRKYERNLRENRPDDYHARNKRRYQRYKASASITNRKWVSAHPEQRRAYGREWGRRNREKRAVAAQRDRARRANLPGSFTLTDIHMILTVQRGRCAYCLTALTRPYHIDHMTAVVREGSSNWSWNLCLACPRCNQRKHAMNAGEFLALLIKEGRTERH